jgi:hypothetical protein
LESVLEAKEKGRVKIEKKGKERKMMKCCVLV